MLLKWWLLFGYVTVFLFLATLIASGDSTQTNTSGSNTAIEGGYTSSSSTTFQSGSSSNTTSTSNNSSNIKSAPPTASAPPLTNGIDTCAFSLTGGVQTFGFGVSAGHTYVEENCQRIKNARELNTLGMKVSAVALLCQDPSVFTSMMSAGTPCPFEGKIGAEAKKLWLEYPELRPDYIAFQEREKAIKLNKANAKQKIYDRYIEEAKK
jgi:hypothetical protein